MSTKCSVFAGLLLSVFVASLSAGCAEPESSPAVEVGEVSKGGRPMADAELKAALAKALEGATFPSEADIEFFVVDGDGSKVSSITSIVVKKRLGAAIKNVLQDTRNVSRLPAESESFDNFLENARDNAKDPSMSDFSRKNDAALAAALGLMKQQLKSTAAFSLGAEPEGGGNVIFVFAGKSKTTGRLIALVTGAVFT
jgi:hypothetical protein